MIHKIAVLWWSHPVPLPQYGDQQRPDDYLEPLAKPGEGKQTATTTAVRIVQFAM